MLRKIVPYAIVALLVSAGSATAAATITGKQVKDNSLTTRDIKNKTLKTADISAAAKRALRGSRGPAGTAGPAGPPGPSIVSGRNYVEYTFSVAPGDVDIQGVECPGGQNVVMGGYTTIGAGTETFVNKSYGGTDWSVGVDNFNSTVAATVTAHGWCVPAGAAVAASVGKSRRIKSERRADEAAQRATH